ncbi:hypothetical protein [Citrobacter phage IME-JL8]|uniref:Uncharacterized protein n=1 Tax=Citrobacter phage IME-JL8 TaxID=2709754 RepID=A0A6G6XTL0_9CAUD|nr:hypothetical protein [Citrobacter phage IME-JL8]
MLFSLKSAEVASQRQNPQEEPGNSYASNERYYGFDYEVFHLSISFVLMG